MKSLILITLLTSSFALAKKEVKITPPPAATTNSQIPSEMKVGVRGMVCAFCAQGIDKKFMSQPEVSKVEVSLENKYVKIKFKEGQSLAQEKITQILKDSGYEAVYGE